MRSISPRPSCGPRQRGRCMRLARWKRRKRRRKCGGRKVFELARQREGSTTLSSTIATCSTISMSSCPPRAGCLQHQQAPPGSHTPQDCGGGCEEQDTKLVKMKEEEEEETAEMVVEAEEDHRASTMTLTCTWCGRTWNGLLTASMCARHSRPTFRSL